MSGRESVQIPDDRDFDQFRTECNSEAGWHLTYHRSGIAVWIQMLEAEKSLHKIKVSPLLSPPACPSPPSPFGGGRGVPKLPCWPCFKLTRFWGAKAGLGWALASSRVCGEQAGGGVCSSPLSHPLGGVMGSEDLGLLDFRDVLPRYLWSAGAEEDGCKAASVLGGQGWWCRPSGFSRHSKNQDGILADFADEGLFMPGKNLAFGQPE